MAANSQFLNIPDEQVFIFHKDEIVWAKMKFFSAWPAKVRSIYHYSFEILLNLLIDHFYLIGVARVLRKRRRL
jgi:hypothetical protein